MKKHNIPVNLYAKNFEKNVCEMSKIMTNKAIAKEMSVSENTILRILKNHGLNSSNIDHEMDLKIYELYKKTSAKEASNQLCIPIGKVYDSVRRVKTNKK